MIQFLIGKHILTAILRIMKAHLLQQLQNSITSHRPLQRPIYIWVGMKL